MQAAKQIIDIGKDIYSDVGAFTAKVKGKKFLETIDWKDIDLEEEEYMMQVFPTSSLSQTPAGRLQDIQELIQAGFIDKNYALKLLDYPDLEGYMNMANAGIDDLEDTIETIADKGEYKTPEPYQNLALGVQTFQSAYLKYKGDGLEEEKLELLRRWMSEAQIMITPPMPSQMPMAAVAPTAAPEAPPVSDLIPNAPGGVM